MDNSIINTLLGFIGVISQLLIFIASVYFLIKCKGTKATLLTLGSGFSLVMSIFYQIVPLFLNNGSFYGNISAVYTIAGFFSSIFYIVFAAGFFMLLFKLANQPKQDFSQFLPNNYEQITNPNIEN